MVTQKKQQKKGKRSSPRKPKALSLPLLLEIGTEEIPTTFLPQALQDLAELGRQLLNECRLDYDQVRTVGTCRRLALLVDGLQAQQCSVTQEVIGPPKSAAFDTSNVPTKAAQGFAKSQGVSVEELTIKETSKGLYLAVRKHKKGQSAKQVLTENLPSYLAKLTFSKAMRWNASQVKFARPIRWIVALLGNQALKIEFAGVRSSVDTWGHRYFPAKGNKAGNRMSLTTAATYIKTMGKVGVMVDPEERRKEINTQVARLAKLGKGQIDANSGQELIEEAVWGVEYPHAILGTFQEEFLSLPKAVLISSMKEHQGFLSLVAKDDHLLPKFVAVTNTPWGNHALIKKGNERVLSARLKDAQYFFHEDKRQRLVERVPALDGVVFHHKLGTMRQKVERIQALAGWMAEALGPQDLKFACQRAGLLSKADLTTGMVGEFPNLQGVMGEEYAHDAGESQDVCQAIREHYLPRFSDDQLPRSLPGMIVACADRCDSIASFFAVGMAPSGSEDPLGLRRAAYGLVRILSETSLKLNLVDVFEQTIAILAKQGVGQGNAKILGEVMEFVMDRLRFYGQTAKGLRDDVLEAVIAVRLPQTADIGDLLFRMQVLQDYVRQPGFEPLMIGFKRAHRIVEKETWTQTTMVPERFQHESEQQLFHLLDKAQQDMTACVASQDYSAALQVLLTFKTPIDTFFSTVLVNDPDSSIRENRLSLLSAVDRLFLTIADFSHIQGAGNESG